MVNCLFWIIRKISGWADLLPLFAVAYSLLIRIMLKIPSFNFPLLPPSLLPLSPSSLLPGLLFLSMLVIVNYLFILLALVLYLTLPTLLVMMLLIWLILVVVLALTIVRFLFCFCFSPPSPPLLSFPLLFFLLLFPSFPSPLSSSSPLASFSSPPLLLSLPLLSSPPSQTLQIPSIPLPLLLPKNIYLQTKRVVARLKEPIGILLPSGRRGPCIGDVRWSARQFGSTNTRNIPPGLWFVPFCRFLVQWFLSKTIPFQIGGAFKGILPFSLCWTFHHRWSSPGHSSLPQRSFGRFLFPAHWNFQVSFPFSFIPPFPFHFHFFVPFPPFLIPPLPLPSPPFSSPF